MVTDQNPIINMHIETPIKMNKIKMTGEEDDVMEDVDKLVETVLQDSGIGNDTTTISVVTDSNMSELPDYSDVNDDDFDEGDEDEEMVDMLLDYDEVFEMIKVNGARSFIDEQVKVGVTLAELYQLFEVETPNSSDADFLKSHLEDEVNQMALEYDEEDGMDEDDEDGSSCVALSSDEGEESSLLSEAEKAEKEAKAMAILKEIRAKGPMGFVDEQEALDASASDFLRSIGYSLPQSLSPLDSHSQWTFVRKFLLKYVYQRQRLPNCESVDDAVRLIAGAKNIMVVTGAGISVSCGIPDFRSEHGLYASIRERFDLPEPECMFDIEYFRDDPEPFFMLAKELFPGRFKPSPCHYFIKQLEVNGQLRRNFTQNIDTLEEIAAIEKVVYCHGSFATATCLYCKRKYGVEELGQRMTMASVPLCDKCDGEDEAVIKPDIVFFGEPLPKAFDDHLDEDTAKTDLLIVIGSSLKVQPVSMIPDLLDPSIPQILINRERLDHNFDIELLGDADGIVCELARRLGWSCLGDTPVPADIEHLVQTAVPLHVHLFKGAKYGLRPEIPEAKSDGSVLSEALVGDSIDISQVFPKPPQTPILTPDGHLEAADKD